MLKNMFMFFATDYTENKEYCSSLLNEKDTEDFKQMWSGFVQQFIDFVNSHPNVKETISREKERLDSMWNDNNCKYRIEPDLNIHFGADCLDESIKEEHVTRKTTLYGTSVSIDAKDITDDELNTLFSKLNENIVR